MRKIKEVLRLNANKMSNRKIAVCCGIGRSVVADYLRRAANAGLAWPLPPGLSDAEIDQRLFPPPPIKANRDQTVPIVNQHTGEMVQGTLRNSVH